MPTINSQDIIRLYWFKACTGEPVRLSAESLKNPANLAIRKCTLENRGGFQGGAL
jgi:hypothetical protein